MTIRIPKISIVIACFNQARELELTLTSFLQQSLSYSSYELIVVDDHSPDYSARDVVAKFCKKYSDAALLYIRRYRKDGGKYCSSAIAKNIGLRLSRGQYVFFNNADIVQAGETVAHILKVMDSAKKPLCLRGRVIDLPYDEIVNRTPFERELIHDHADRKRERVASADHAGLAAVARAHLLYIGGIDERFDYWGKEDLDIAARLKRIGVTYVYDENLKSFHISHRPNHLKEGDYLRMSALLNENNSQGRIEVNQGYLWGTLNRPPKDTLVGTIIVEANADTEDLSRRLEAILYSPVAERHETIVICLDLYRSKVEAVLVSRFRTLPLISLAHGYSSNHVERVMHQVRTTRLAFLPVGAVFSNPQWNKLAEDKFSLIPWVSGATLPEHITQPLPNHAIGWLATTALLRGLPHLGPTTNWTLLQIANSAKQMGLRVHIC